MSRSKIIKLSLLVGTIATLVGIFALSGFYLDLSNRISQHETIILGQNNYVPGSEAALRVVVRDSKDASSIEGAEVDVSMKPEDGGKSIELFNGKTNNQGTVDVSFSVPENAEQDQTLVIRTKSQLGADTIQRNVTLSRDYRVLISTDKPLYQPGQVIHIRTLALGSFDMVPASGERVEFTIADGKGNKVFRKSVETSRFGVSSVDFKLAGEVNTGTYKISAVLGNTSSEKSVTVEHYVLPKFKLDLSTERSFYLPGQRVEGTLSANYFFGKPVAGGQVLLEGYTYDVERVNVISLQGNTDEQGNFDFGFNLPAYIAGSDLESGLGHFYLQVTVIDLAQHSETSNLSVPISQDQLVIEAVPEGGWFRPGVENILYVLVSYPDGEPAEAKLNLLFPDTQSTIETETGKYGLAEVRFEPENSWQRFSIEAVDIHGNHALKDFSFEGEYTDETVLLRPDKPVYRVGDTMNLTILSSKSGGMVYVDIVREGQTVSTRSMEISDGQAEMAVDLTPDLYGTLELHAYKILSWGGITRDTRTVVVDNASDLNLEFTLDREEYSPGGEAGLDIFVSDPERGGVHSAVGLAVVDESVFALAEQDPGFAKLYFLLEQELLEPKYDLHGYSVPQLIEGIEESDTSLIKAIEDTTQASLAASTPKSLHYNLEANSHDEAIQRANDRKESYFNNLSKGLFGALLLIPVVILYLTGAALWKEKHLGRSILLGVGIIVVLALLVKFWPLGKDYSWAENITDRLGLMIQWLSWQGTSVFLFLGLLGILGYISLVVISWWRKIRNLRLSLVLLIAFVFVILSLMFAASQANIYPSDKVVIVALGIFTLLPLSFLSIGAGFIWKRQFISAFAALFVGLFLIIGTFPALSMTTGSANFLGGRGALMGGDMFGMEDVMEVKEMAPQGMPEPVAEAESPRSGESGDTNEPPRLRQYFPETMLWLPDAETGEDGLLHLDFPVADSITTWRMTALASTQDGRLGSATAGLRVFQDFFIDLDLPLALTVGDEVSIPVGVFNYLEESQEVRIELEESGWFELLDEPEKVMNIEANDISVTYFRVRAIEFGKQPFKVTAWGTKMSDAMLKEVRVFPDGKKITFSQSDRLNEETNLQESVQIPEDAIPGTETLLVKIYPGIVSQVVEGLDSILRMPYGCFEQTSSTTYPNVLVLDYLKTTSQTSPEVQFKAEDYINLGYQRLTTFEVENSGGFSLFGDAPADRMLTAYGLQEFGDMKRVFDIDQALIDRAAEWLLSQQDGDGSWENDRGLVHENSWANLGNDRLPVTAYIVWSLVDAGFADDARTQKGVSYIREYQSQAEDAYEVALLANALVAVDLKEGGAISPSTENVLNVLVEMAKKDGSKVFWSSDVATFMGSEGVTGSIETTALGAYALLRSEYHPDLANGALTYLIQKKDNFGTWHSTQATVLSLKALIQSVRSGREATNATVTVSLDREQVHKLEINPENFDVVQQVSFDVVNAGGRNLVDISTIGEGNLMYQIAGSYYLPWEKLADYPELSGGEQLVSIDLNYDRAELAVNDTVEVDVIVRLNQEGGRAESALIDLGLPPGFTVLSEDLAALVARYDDVPDDYEFPTVERFELTGRQILIYASNLSSAHPLKFNYRLRAKFPIKAQTPASNAYDYYNPDVSGVTPPQQLVVVE